jgi:hypothetical protein
MDLHQRLPILLGVLIIFTHGPNNIFIPFSLLSSPRALPTSYIKVLLNVAARFKLDCHEMLVPLENLIPAGPS